MNRPLRERYDVVVLGGAFSGASTAMLLKRDHPEISVLVVEKSKQFDAKVGEATTEMSAMFLTRRLAQWRHLELDQSFEGQVGIRRRQLGAHTLD